MKIGVNAITDSSNIRGPVRYTIELLNEFLTIDTINNYFLFLPPWLEDLYNKNIKKTKNLEIVIFKSVPQHRILRNLWQLFIMPLFLRKYDLDIYHIPDTSPYIFKARGYYKTIVTIHDIAEYRIPHRFSKMQSLSRRLISKTEANHSDYILTVSNFSKNEIINEFKISEKKIYVVYNGISNRLIPPINNNSFKKIRDKYSLLRRFILFVGVLEKGKNVKNIISAFLKLPKNLKDNYDIVLVGKKGNEYPEIDYLIRKNKLSDKVFILGYLEDDELFNLYNEASLFLYLSEYEGFGLPPLEAMRCGCPVIAANSSSLPEVVGDAGKLVSPSSIIDIADAIKEVLSDDTLRTTMIIKGLKQAQNYSWNKAANEILKIYKILYSDIK